MVVLTNSDTNSNVVIISAIELVLDYKKVAREVFMLYFVQYGMNSFELSFLWEPL